MNLTIDIIQLVFLFVAPILVNRYYNISIFRFRKLKKILGKKHSGSRKGEPSKTESTIKLHFLKYFEWLWFLWFLFYFIRVIEDYIDYNFADMLLLSYMDNTLRYISSETLNDTIWNFLRNSLNNISAFLVLMCYLGLSIPYFQNEWKKNKLYRINKAGWMFIFLGFVAFEFIFTLNAILNGKFNEGEVELFGFLSGLLMSLSLFLFVGRMDSNIIKKGLEKREQAEKYVIFKLWKSKDFYNGMLVFLYLYSAIQTLYPYLSSNEHEIVGNYMALFAFLMKFVLLLLLISILVKSGNNEPSVLVKYFDEIRDLHYHVQTDYKHQFLKSNFPGIYKSKHFKSGEGYLGIEYIRMSEIFKDEIGYGKEDALFVTEVHHNSGARKAGIKVGDVITAIDGNFVTAYFTLGRLLKERKIGETVLIDIENLNGKFRIQSEIIEANSVLPEKIDKLNQVFLGINRKVEITANVKVSSTNIENDKVVQGYREVCHGVYQKSFQNKYNATAQQMQLLPYRLKEFYPGFTSADKSIFTTLEEGKNVGYVFLNPYGLHSIKRSDNFKISYNFNEEAELENLNTDQEKSVANADIDQNKIKENNKLEAEKSKKTVSLSWESIGLDHSCEVNGELKISFNQDLLKPQQPLCFSSCQEIDKKNIRKWKLNSDKIYFSFEDESKDWRKIDKFHNYSNNQQVTLIEDLDFQKIVNNSNDMSFKLVLIGKVSCRFGHNSDKCTSGENGTNNAIIFEKKNKTEFRIFEMKFLFKKVNKNGNNTFQSSRPLLSITSTPENNGIKFLDRGKMTIQEINEIVLLYAEVFERPIYTDFYQSNGKWENYFKFDQNFFVVNSKILDLSPFRVNGGCLKFMIFNEKNQIIFKYKILRNALRKGAVVVPFFNAQNHLGRKKLMIWDVSNHHLIAWKVEIIRASRND